MQYLVVIALIAFVYFVFIKKKPIKKQEMPKKKDERLQGNDLVQCPSCGVYTEVDEALLSSGKYYCSKECLEK
jgi:uncharacterized protein